MYNNFIIRPMCRQDLTAAYKIEQENYEFPWSYENFIASLEYSDNNYIILNKTGAVLGFIMLVIVLDECQLINIAISKQYHRNGLGYNLLKYVMGSLPSTVNTIWLEVKKSNIAAQKLYKSLSFQMVDQRINYYRTGNSREDALIYMKKVS